MPSETRQSTPEAGPATSEPEVFEYRLTWTDVGLAHIGMSWRISFMPPLALVGGVALLGILATSAMSTAGEFVAREPALRFLLGVGGVMAAYVFLLVPALALWTATSWRHENEKRARREGPQWTRLSLREEGVVIEEPSGRTEMKWSRFYGWAALPRHIVLLQSRGFGFILPKEQVPATSVMAWFEHALGPPVK